MELIRALVLLLVVTGRAQQQEPQKSPGETAFTRVCESCHGPKANGDGQGPALVPYSKELAELVAIVRQGVGLMPGLPKSQVTDNEIEQIHAYLKELTSRQAPRAQMRIQ